MTLIHVTEREIARPIFARTILVPIVAEQIATEVSFMCLGIQQFRPICVGVSGAVGVRFFPPRTAQHVVLSP